jgi:hypothetical protein
LVSNDNPIPEHMSVADYARLLEAVQTAINTFEPAHPTEPHWIMYHAIMALMVSAYDLGETYREGLFMELAEYLVSPQRRVGARLPGDMGPN